MENDLAEIRSLPNCVRDLHTFDNNPVNYIFRLHIVERILQDY